MVWTISGVSRPTFFGMRSSFGNAVRKPSSRVNSPAVPLNSGGTSSKVCCNFCTWSINSPFCFCMRLIWRLNSISLCLCRSSSYAKASLIFLSIPLVSENRGFLGTSHWGSGATVWLFDPSNLAGTNLQRCRKIWRNPNTTTIKFFFSVFRIQDWRIESVKQDYNKAAMLIFSMTY